MDFVLITPSSFFFLFLPYSLAFSAVKTIRRRYKKRNRACAKSTSKNKKVWRENPFGLYICQKSGKFFTTQQFPTSVKLCFFDSKISGWRIGHPEIFFRYISGTSTE